MKSSFTLKHNVRKSFGKIPELLEMPNLLEIQKNSYELFLQKNIKPQNREDIGLQAVFNKVFPIKDFSGKAELQFVKYELENPKYDVKECIQRGGTFASLLKVTLRLIVWEIDEESGSRSIKDIKEQEVYLGDIPLMTDKGTFVFNGTTRVVVSQMHRSPGVFFDHDKGKSHSTGKFLFASRLIPYNGSWIDFEFDSKDLLYVRIDKRRKLLASSLLLALENEKSVEYREKTDSEQLDYNKITGLSHEEIFSFFYNSKKFIKKDNGWEIDYIKEDYIGSKLNFDLIDSFEKVTDENAAIYTRRLAKEEGIFAGNSCGAAVSGVVQLKKNFSKDDVVVVLLHDSGSRYVGKIYNDEWMKNKGFKTD